MKKNTIREKLHSFIDITEEKKLKAIYTLLADEIEENQAEYSNEFKEELDKRAAYYQNGGKMVSASEADKQIRKVLQSARRK